MSDDREAQNVETFRSLAKIVTGGHTNYQEAYQLTLASNKTKGLFFAARLFMGFTNLRLYKDVFEVPIGMNMSLDRVIPEILGLPTPFPGLPPLLPVPLPSPLVFPPPSPLSPPPASPVSPGAPPSLRATQFVPPLPQPNPIDQDSLVKLWVLTTRTGFFTQDWRFNARTNAAFGNAFTTLKHKYGPKFTWTTFDEIIDSGNWNAILLFVQIAAFKLLMANYMTRSRGLKQQTFQRLKKRAGVCVVQFEPYSRREGIGMTGGRKEYMAPKSAVQTLAPSENGDVNEFLRGVLPSLLNDDTPADETRRIYDTMKALYVDHKPSTDFNEQYNFHLDDNLRDPVFRTGRLFQGFANLYNQEDVFECPDGMNYKIREDELLGPSRAIHLWVLCSRIGFFSKTFILKPSVEAHLMWAFSMLRLPSEKWETYVDLVMDMDNDEMRHTLFVQLAAMLYQITIIFVRDDKTLKVYEGLLKEINNTVLKFQRSSSY